MIKADNDKKTFLLKNVYPFQEICRSKFQSIYKEMIIKFLLRNETVYLEGAPANLFFIIYNGLFRIEKKNVFQHDNENPDFLTNDINRNHTVLKLGSGDIAGIETLIYYYKTQNLNNNNITAATYNYSLVADDECNIILCINPQTLASELRKNLVKFFHPIIEKKEKIFKDYLIKHSTLQKKMKLTFREELTRGLSKNRISYYKRAINDKLEINQSEREKNHIHMEQNDFKNFSFKFSTESIFSNKLLNSTQEVSDKKSNGIKINLFNSSSVKNTKEFSKNLNTSSPKINDNITRRSTRKSNKIFQKIRLNFKNKNDKIFYNTIESDTEGRKHKISINSLYKESSNETISDIKKFNENANTRTNLTSLNTELNSMKSLDKVFKSSNKLTSNIIYDDNVTQLNPEGSIKIFKKLEIKKINSKRNDNKFIKNTTNKSANKWKYVITNEDYNSGSYELPLVSNFLDSSQVRLAKYK